MATPTRSVLPLDSGAPAAQSAYDDQVLTEQINTLNRFLPLILAVNVLVGAAMIFALRGIADTRQLLVWAVTLLAVVGFRLGMYSSYRRSQGNDTLRTYCRYFSAGAALSGLLWGTAGVLFFQPGQLDYQLFILFILVGMGAGAVSSLTAYMPAFYAYFPVSILPIGIYLSLQNTTLHTGLAIMTLVYVVALSFFGHNIGRSFVLSLRLRFENMDLVAQLSEQKEQAEQANVAKSQFLAAASHDLRQPLHALTLYVSVLDEAIRNPEQRSILDQINHSIRTLQNLFNALLDISKLEAGTLVPERSDFRLKPLLDSLRNDFAADALAKHLELDIQDSDAWVFSDPALLEQILRNYLSNAIRYTDSGGIRLRCTRQGAELRIDVSDSGRGIAAEQQRAIFREFYQLGNPERDRNKGLGLGLAIVERISRLLGHPIAVDSRPAQGSTFSVCVPAGMAGSETPHGAIERAGRGALQARLVVIDDDIGVRESTRTLLESWGCHVTASASVDEAIASLKETSQVPDGVIADYRLQDGQTGIEAISALRERFGEALPAIIITGDIDAQPLRDIQDSGIQLLHKPVPAAKYRAFVNNVQRARARD